MSKASDLRHLAIALAVWSFLGCAKQNFRTITRIDTKASVKGHLPWQPQDGFVITVWTDPRAATMSTLYGNDIAVRSARSASHTAYPAGAAVALVTWEQKEDERWFGADIPATPVSTEFVTVTMSLSQRSEYLYQRYTGNPLQQSWAEAMSIPQGRTAYILSQPAAKMP